MMVDEFSAATPLMSELSDSEPVANEYSEAETHGAAPPVERCVGAREATDDTAFTAFDGKLWVHVLERRYPADRPGYRYARDRGRDGEWATGKSITPLNSRLDRQWLYVLREQGGSRTLKYEIYANAVGDWYEKIDPDVNLPAHERVAGWSNERADCEPKDSVILDPQYEWCFFLSQAQLDSETLKELLNSQEEDLFVKADFMGQFPEVEVPDPYRWSEDIHTFEYRPAVDEWIGFTTPHDGMSADEKKETEARQARLFIAEGLTQLLGKIEGYDEKPATHFENSGKPGLVPSGAVSPEDPLGLINELAGSDWLAPYREVARYRQREYGLRKEAEESLLNVLDWVYGAAHRLVDQAVLKMPGTKVTTAPVRHNSMFGVEHWGKILVRMLDTQPGRDFLHSILAQPGANTEEMTPVDGASPADTRRWIPGEMLYQTAPDAEGKTAPHAAAGKRSFDDSRKLIDWVSTGSGWAGQIYGLVFGTLVAQKGSAEAISLAQAGLQRLGYNLNVVDLHWNVIHGDVQLKFKGWPVGEEIDQLKFEYERVSNSRAVRGFVFFKKVTDVLKCLNFVLATNKLMDSADPKAKSIDRLAAVLGWFSAGKDMAEIVMVGLINGYADKAVVKVGGSLLGYVGGILTITVESRDFGSALSAGDYSKSVGHGIAIGGGLIAFIGAAVVLSNAVGVTLLGTGAALEVTIIGAPVGTVLAVVGGIICAIGGLLSAFTADSNYEKFASHCFFGSHYGEDSEKTGWSEVSFLRWKTGAKGDSAEELEGLLIQKRALTRLFAQFVLSEATFTKRTKFANSSVRVSPGFLSKNSRFIVTITSDFEPNRTGTENVGMGHWRLKATASINPFTERVTMGDAYLFKGPNGVRELTQDRTALTQHTTPGLDRELEVTKNDAGLVRTIDVGFRPEFGPGHLFAPKNSRRVVLTVASVQLDLYGDGKSIIPKQPLSHHVYVLNEDRSNAKTGSASMGG